MAFSIVSRGILRTSREVLERNMAATVGVLHQTASPPPNTPISHSDCHRLASGGNICGHGAHSLLWHQMPTAVVQAVRQYSKKAGAAKLRREVESDSDSDSDDEFERRRQKMDSKRSERGDSAFWRRKMRTLHRILDVNHDGVVSFDDFSLLAKRFSDLGHLTPEVAAEFNDVIKHTWEEQFGEITPYNLVTAEQFLTDLHHRLNDKKMAKRIGRFLPYLFKAVDFDHTGHLDLEQYKLFFRCLGLTEDDAAVSFAVIDKNGDGQLSLKEFVHLGRQFFLTEDDSKISKMFWGPLVADH
ncbi:sarcoplasmic calcium-binding protein isoform X1 [Drosophila sechellia]|uniref:GM17516 n=1 Tax=Drosophila sechellia TaxID=7238 RepID=B4IHL3_DROSE|nr:sarcoplasmic calcium-binding protein isoform X1 [Drosophila sechellia]EDW49364.1 GM17516 [Drosophila sechellia]